MNEWIQVSEWGALCPVLLLDLCYLFCAHSEWVSSLPPFLPFPFLPLFSLFLTPLLPFLPAMYVSSVGSAMRYPVRNQLLFTKSSVFWLHVSLRCDMSRRAWRQRLWPWEPSVTHSWPWTCLKVEEGAKRVFDHDTEGMNGIRVRSREVSLSLTFPLFKSKLFSLRLVLGPSTPTHLSHFFLSDPLTLLPASSILHPPSCVSHGGPSLKGYPCRV